MNQNQTLGQKKKKGFQKMASPITMKIGTERYTKFTRYEMDVAGVTLLLYRLILQNLRPILPFLVKNIIHIDLL